MRDLHTLDKFRLNDAERLIYGVNGDSGKGFFKVHVNGRSFKVIASNGGGWEHVSVSPWSDKRITQMITLEMRLLSSRRCFGLSVLKIIREDLFSDIEYFTVESRNSGFTDIRAMDGWDTSQETGLWAT